MPDDEATPAACLNCGYVFVPARLNYCPACGQETNVKPPTLREFAQQFGGSYIAAEGALWRSLRLLLFKPGELTREYLQGRRRRYVLPLRLYLTISVIALLALRLVSVAPLEATERTIASQPARTASLRLGFGEAELKNGQFRCTGLPEWMCERLKRRLVADRTLQAHQVAVLGERVLAHLGGVMFVLLPSFALWMWLAYRNRGLRYTEHLVFALHVHAFWFVMLMLKLVDWTWLSVIAGVLVPAYTMLAMHRVFGGRWWLLLLRAGAVSALYGVTFTLMMSALSVALLLF